MNNEELTPDGDIEKKQPKPGKLSLFAIVIVSILLIAGGSFGVSLLLNKNKIDWAKSKEAFQSLEKTSEDVTKKCSGLVERTMDADDTEEDYDNFLKECDSAVIEYNTAIALLKKESAVKSNDKIKEKYDAFIKSYNALPAVITDIPQASSKAYKAASENRDLYNKRVNSGVLPNKEEAKAVINKTFPDNELSDLEVRVKKDFMASYYDNFDFWDSQWKETYFMTDCGAETDCGISERKPIEVYPDSLVEAYLDFLSVIPIPNEDELLAAADIYGDISSTVIYQKFLSKGDNYTEEDLKTIEIMQKKTDEDTMKEIYPLQLDFINAQKELLDTFKEQSSNK